MVATIRSLMGQISKLRALTHGIPDWIDRTVFYFSLMSIRSSLPIEVLIPAIDKDAQILPYAIDGIRRNVCHPIAKIFVVAPPSERIRRVCRTKDCEFLDERQLVQFDPDSFGLEVNGVDRSRWIYQQFLKWRGDSVVDTSHYLVV
ncbi:MAG TPA: hypothetical protein VLY63_20770, partial [Anaerolineae bacterium]|nr:hypothetical protein [Anaerolineae bacterium]